MKDTFQQDHCIEEVSELAERADNPTTTHIPILIGLAKLMIVNRVMELGAGQYSTPLFLNRSVFSHLIALHTFENNAGWIDKIKKWTDDSRLRLTSVISPMYTLIKKIDLSAFDIIFVDDSATIQARVKTILKVARNYYGAGIVVIHDYERPINRKASRALKNHFRFTAFNPNTGICWNHPAINRNDFEELNALLKRYAPCIRPDDVDGWLQVIR
jgi:hypothetical protein